MALIKCPYCGKPISDKAKKCIYCGRLLNQNAVYEEDVLLDEESLETEVVSEIDNMECESDLEADIINSNESIAEEDIELVADSSDECLQSDESIVQSVLETMSDSIEEIKSNSSITGKLINSKLRDNFKKIVLICVTIIIVAVGIVCVSFLKSIKVDFDVYEDKPMSVGELECHVPENWEITGSENEKRAALYPSISSSPIATYKVKYMGDYDSWDKAMDYIYGYPGTADLEYDEVSIKGCKEAWISNVYENKQGWTEYVYVIYCDRSLFYFQCQAKDISFNKDEFTEMVFSCDFDDFVTPAIESISATYLGKFEGGVEINSDNEDVDVQVHYNTGKSKKVASWTIENPGTLEWGTVNKFNIKYGEWQCVLEIDVDYETYDGSDATDFGQVANTTVKEHRGSGTTSSYNPNLGRVEYFVDYEEMYSYELSSDYTSVLEKYFLELSEDGFEDTTFGERDFWWYTKGDEGDYDYEKLFIIVREENGKNTLSIYLGAE